MKKLSCLFLLAICSTLAFGQNSVVVEENDPAATAILEKIKAKYEAYKSLDVNFTLTIEFPEEEPEIQKGHISQKGDQYKLDLESQSITSDGKTIWFHLKNRNEVQINDVEEGDDQEMLSPQNLLRIYEKNDYLYALVGEELVKGVEVQQIEFKPIDRNSEYAKMRLSLNKKTKEIISIKTFGKDGSRYTLKIDALTPDKIFDDKYFQFDESKFPGIHVENLRTD